MKRSKHIIQDELDRYKDQLTALKQDASYNQNEEARANIKAFYIFKIGELTAEKSQTNQLECNRIKGIKVEGAFELPNTTGPNQF